MIFDIIENLDRYNLDLSFINDILNKNIFNKGKFEIDDSKFGICLEYETKDSTDAIWEAHRKYLDIHYVLEGEEYVEISDIQNMQSSKGYEDDYELFTGLPQQKILLSPGKFLILFPNEVHKTSVKIVTPCLVKKIVFKSQLSGQH